MTKRIGRFDLAESLGEGTFGSFFRGHDPATGREVAIQTIRLDARVTPEARETALRDARAAAALSHPSIAPIYDIGTDGETAYVVREFVDGQSLARVITDGAPFRPDAVVAWLEQIADALDYAHKRGVIHGALEPVHVILTSSGKIKITGFGAASLAAKAMHDAQGLVGLPEYMAPEKIRGELVDGRCDVYSLGAIAFELLTATRPFGGGSTVTTIFKAVNDPPPSPRALAPTISEETDAVVQRAMAKDAGERFISSRAFVDAFKAGVRPAFVETLPVGSGASTADAIFCDQCGTAIRPGVRFCYKCGAPTTDELASEPEPVPEPMPVPVVEHEVEREPEPEPAVLPVIEPERKAEPAAELQHVEEPAPAFSYETVDEVLPTEVAVLPTEVAPVPVLRPDRVAPPLAGYAASTGQTDLPPPGASLEGKPKSGIFSGILPVLIVLFLILFLFGLFGFMIAPRLLAPQQAPAPQTSAIAAVQ